MKKKRRRHRSDEEFADRKPRRRLRILAVLLTLVLALLIAEVVASRMIAQKLRRTVEAKLDAQLELGPLVYIPPYGAWAWNSRVTRDGNELFSFSSVRLALAEFPLKDKPLIISQLHVHQPVLSLARGRFDDIRKPPTKDDTVPRKLSGMLRLKHVRVTNGQVSYVDANRPGAPPTVWGNIALDIDTIQTSVSKYTFHLASRAAPLAEVAASGTIDVDDGLLDLQSSSMKLRAEPDPPRSPLPAALQQFIRTHRINGSVTVNASGRFPLRDPKQSSFSAGIGLVDATAVLPDKHRQTIDHAQASLVAKMTPGGPLVARIDRVAVGSRGRQVVVNEGLIEVNPQQGTWSVSDVDGEVSFTPPGGNVAAALAAPSALAVTRPTTAGSGAGGDDDQRPLIDKLELAGKGKFTAAVSGPFDFAGKPAAEAIRHTVILYPRDASFRPKDFVRRIEGVGGGEVRFENGMLVFQELDGHYGEDLLRLRSARVPIDGLPKLTRWQEISGTVIFHRPHRRYSPKLDKIIDPLNPNGPFLIAGSWVVDKRDGNLTPEGKPKHTFDLIVSSDTGSFMLTEKNILLERMRGDATVNNDGVELHELEAQVLEGTIQATGRWARDPDKIHSSYEGELRVRDVDLALCEGRVRDVEPAKPLEGRVYVAASVRGGLAKGASKEENLRTVDAAGEIEIIKGSLFKMPVVKHVTEQVKGLKGAANVGDAAAEFEIEKGRLKLRNAAVSSPIVGLQGGGTLLLDGSEVDLRVVAAPLADWRDNLKATNIPVVSNVAGELAGGLQKMLNAATGALLYEFRVQGSLEKPQVVAVPTPVLTDTAAFVFERMLAPPKKDQRPIDLLRRERQETTRVETR